MDATNYRIPTAAESLEVARRVAADRATVNLENEDRFLRVTGCFAEDGRRLTWDILEALLDAAGVREGEYPDTAYRRCISSDSGYVGVWLLDPKDLPDYGLDD
jgi:hypothetical protein